MQRIERSVDAALIGEWKVTIAENTAYVRINNDGWGYYSGTSNKWELQSQGTILETNADTPKLNSKYTRLYGDPVFIVGVWKLQQLDNGINWIEEFTIRADNSYSSYWTADGAFDSELHGMIIGLGAGRYRTEERRGAFSTAGPNLSFDGLYIPDYTGQYSVVNDNKWELFENGVKTRTYDRFPFGTL